MPISFHRRMAILGGFDFDTWLKSTPPFSTMDWFHGQETSGSVALSDNTALALGRELVINWDFLNWSGVGDIDDWAETVVANTEITQVDSGQANGGTNVVGGSVNLYNNGGSASRPAISPTVNTVLEVGKTYSYSLIVSNVAAGGGQLLIGGQTIAINTSATYTGTFTATAQTIAIRCVASVADITLDSLSVKQTGILASSAYSTPGDNPMDGTYYGVSLGAEAAGTNLGYKPYYVTNDYLTILSAEKNSKTIPTSYHEVLFIEPTWDTTERYILNYYVDADNWIRIIDTSTAGTITWEHRAGGTTESVSLATGSPSGLFAVGISVESAVMKAWYKTGQTGSDQSVAGTFVGNFAQMDIGSDGGASKFFNGYITRIGSETSELSVSDWLNLVQNSGTI